MFSFFSKKLPKQVVAHVLDDDYIGDERCYRTKLWQVGQDIAEKYVADYADGENVFVLVTHPDDKTKISILSREKWIFFAVMTFDFDDAGIAAIEHAAMSLKLGQSKQDSGSDAVFMNENMANKKAIIIGNSKAVEIDGASITVILLSLVEEGWDSGSDIFLGDNTALKLSRNTIPKKNASVLADMLRHKFGNNPASSLGGEEGKIIHNLMSIADLGEFTIDLVDK